MKETTKFGNSVHFIRRESCQRLPEEGVRQGEADCCHSSCGLLHASLHRTDGKPCRVRARTLCYLLENTPEPEPAGASRQMSNTLFILDPARSWERIRWGGGTGKTTVHLYLCFKSNLWLRHIHYKFWIRAEKPEAVYQIFSHTKLNPTLQSKRGIIVLTARTSSLAWLCAEVGES